VNPPRNPHPNFFAGQGCPYRDLYIYYLQGKLNAERFEFEDNFIGNWEEESFSFLFFSSPASSAVAKLVNSHPQLTLIDSYQMSYDQWLGERFTTLDSGKFHIIPSWESAPERGSNPGKINILMDPGVVFGTGTHATTCDCLEALELATATTPPETALDLGTGTGLLALAAAKSGCKKIIAVDLNLLAAETAANNVKLNHLDQRVLVTRGRAQDFIEYPADIVIANIHFDVMREIIASQGFLEKDQFILSGLLRGEAKAVIAKLAQYPVKLIKTWTSDSVWHTIYGRKC
jgi:ribosomal protein L11 methyltransferase